MRRIHEPHAYRADPKSYWQTTASPPVFAPLKGDATGDAVIIGAGFTGLNAALELEDRGLSAVLLDAMQPGWGASGRNGGFVGGGGTKLSLKARIARFGATETKRFFAEQLAAIDTVAANLETYSIEADVHSDGEDYLAHRAEEWPELIGEERVFREFFGRKARLIPREELAAEGLNSPEFHGSLRVPWGFAVNPMKYVAGLARAVLDAGIAAHGDSPAIAIRREGADWLVETPGGAVRARHLLIATNGYSSEDIPHWLAGRLLPVLSNIIVSRPLTEAELKAQGWTSHQLCADTRNLLHYFRLMPGIHGEGPRMMFGMRGGVSASERAEASMGRRIRADFDRIFPEWHAVETPYFWSGFVCLTRDLTMYCGPLPGLENAWGSFAYHGSGVALGSHSGRLAARMIAGDVRPDGIPAIMRSPPRPFPFPFLRRTYLAAAYRWHEWRDG